MKYLAFATLFFLASLQAATYHYEIKNGLLNKVQPFELSAAARPVEQRLYWNTGADVKIRYDDRVLELDCIDGLEVCERFIVRAKWHVTIGPVVISPHSFKMAIFGNF